MYSMVPTEPARLTEPIIREGPDDAKTKSKTYEIAFNMLQYQTPIRIAGPGQTI
ncbi:hypothetical protein PACILC2_49210 [Paenibacillus cisolokensis]|uniref:Uncharacterized protein n=1 Tax=Paenibacillus cisolokensis TaxID=1658519 RepID=A0ABQ4NDQ0_9BACL|nr:hypothetical protein PACILC2_49210 [Paenibacillus cisolokensis]